MYAHVQVKQRSIAGKIFFTFSVVAFKTLTFHKVM